MKGYATGREASPRTAKLSFKQRTIELYREYPEQAGYATMGSLFKLRGLTRGAFSPQERRFESELPTDMWQSDARHGVFIEDEGSKRRVLSILHDVSLVIAGK